MDSFFTDMQKIVIELEKINLFRVKIISLIAFILLMISIFFIQMHPKSVWYYFIAGFFTCRMFGLIMEKSSIKHRIQEHMNRLIHLRKGFSYD